MSFSSCSLNVASHDWIHRIHIVHCWPARFTYIAVAVHLVLSGFLLYMFTYIRIVYVISMCGSHFKKCEIAHIFACFWSDCINKKIGSAPSQCRNSTIFRYNNYKTNVCCRILLVLVLANCAAILFDWRVRPPPTPRIKAFVSWLSQPAVILLTSVDSTRTGRGERPLRNSRRGSVLAVHW